MGFHVYYLFEPTITIGIQQSCLYTLGLHNCMAAADSVVVLF